MSTQIVRLSNGDSIQVRTGVLRGSGPAGPVGASNSISVGTVVVGDTAFATLSGDSPNQVLNLVLPRSTTPGPTGSINDYLTDVSTSSNQTVSTGTNTLLSFATITDDELSLYSSSTTFRPVPAGQADRVLSFNVRVTFLNNGTSGSGYRQVWVTANGATTIGESSCDANTLSTGTTVVNVPVIYRFSASETFQVFCKHGGASSLPVSANLRAIRVGSGPTGPQGPVGPANTLSIGTVSTLATGQVATATVTGTAPAQTLNLGLPRGDQGVSGTAGSGYAAIHELDGSGGNIA